MKESIINAIRSEDIARITRALERAAAIAGEYHHADVDVERKAGGSPVTEVDRRLDELLRSILPRDDEGWLSEETADDKRRLGCERVWIVDPIDGTKEFVKGIPEWSISIGLVENGVPVAGGICNPDRNEMIVGSVEAGVTFNGAPARVRRTTALTGARVLASRSEIKRGEWDDWKDGPIELVPVGSVAYKLALVAAGRADATWTLTPKNEWDVAAGTALVRAAGGRVRLPDGSDVTFNRESTHLPGLVATPDPDEVPVWAEVIGRLATSA